MGIATVWALSLAIGFGVIILFYMMKRKAKEEPISSVMFWKQNEQNMEAKTSFEKLKKNLLFFLQLIIWLFLLLALLSPYIKQKQMIKSELVLVVDNSGSMNTKYNEDKTRLDVAIAKAKQRVDEVDDGVKITLVVCNQTPKVIVSKTTDHQLIKQKLEEIKGTDKKGDLNNSLSLVQSFSKQVKDVNSLFFTDTHVDVGDIRGEIISVYKEQENISIDYVSHSEITNAKEGKGEKVLVQATNHGQNVQTVEINLYEKTEGKEETLLAIEEVTLQGKESKSYYFGPYELKSAYIKAELQQKDGLASDNVAYDFIQQTGGKRVLLVTKANLFLERALSLIEGMDVYKTENPDYVDEKEPYDLIIYDGIEPKTIPQNSSVLFINTHWKEIEKVSSKEGEQVAFAQSELTDSFVGETFSVKEITLYKQPRWGNNLLLLHDMSNGSAGFYGTYDGRKVGVIGFDLHNSDLPLMAEFPLFMQSFITYLTETGLISEQKVEAGTLVSLQGRIHGKALKVFDETRQKEENYMDENESEDSMYVEMERAGLYSVSQKVAKETIKSYVAVSFPQGEETVTKPAQSMKINKSEEKVEGMGEKSLRTVCLVLAIFMLLIEWIVYVRRA